MSLAFSLLPAICSPLGFHLYPILIVIANFICTLWAGNYSGASESSGSVRLLFRGFNKAMLKADSKIELARSFRFRSTSSA